MFMHRLNNQLFYAVDDLAISTGDKPNLSKEDIVDLLNTDDEPTEEIDLAPKPKKDKEDKKEDKTEDEPEIEDEPETDELDEIEAELEPEGDDLELVQMPRRSEILKKFPTIFKEFPELEKSFYREREFTTLYPTIDDAREAAEKSKLLDKFDKELRAGNTQELFKTLKNEDPEGFNRLVDNYLETLGKIDQQALIHVVGNVGKNIIRKMFADANESENDVLKNAAAILNQYMFGTTKWTPPGKLAKDAPQEDEESTKLQKERQEFERQRFETARDTLNTRIETTLTRAIEKHIDPRESMTDYIREVASNRALESIKDQLSKDTRFKAVLDKLWDSSHKSGYSRETQERIREACLSRAQTLLPSILKKVRTDALRGMGKRVKNDETNNEDEPNPPAPRERKTVGRSTSSSNSGQNNNGGRKSTIPAGMSNKDYIMADD